MSGLASTPGDATRDARQAPDYYLAGAPDNPEVNLASGQVSLSETLYSVSAGPDLEYSLQFNYNSGTSYQAVVWNQDAPQGQIGMGWSLLRDQVLMLENPMMLPTYLLILGGQTLTLREVESPEGVTEFQSFVTQPHEFWVIQYYPDDSRWTVITEDGTIFKFGGLSGPDANNHSIEYGIQRGNFYADSPSGDQTQEAIVWNLSRMEDQWGNYISFAYEQTMIPLGSTCDYRKDYTRSSHLRTVKSSTGRKIKLSYKSKPTVEVSKPHTIQNPQTEYCHVRGTVISSRDWDDLPGDRGYPDPKVMVTVTDARGGSYNYTRATNYQENAQALEFDLAFPWDGAPDTANIQVIVKAKKAFGKRKIMFDQTFENVEANSGSQTEGARGKVKKTCTVTLDYIKINDTTGTNWPPDAYQDRFETNYLSEVFLVDDTKGEIPIESTVLGYRPTPLGTGALTKRILTSLTRLKPDETELSPPRTFAYYGAPNDPEPAPRVSPTSRYEEANGAVYGALKERVLPSGAVISYSYTSVQASDPRCSLALKVPKPGGDEWGDPIPHFGPDYVVVSSFKKHNQEYSYSLSLRVFTWVGYWTECDLGAIDTIGNNLEIVPGNGFFAVLANSLPSLQLVAQDPRYPAQWTTRTNLLEETVGLSTPKATGRDFIAFIYTSNRKTAKLIIYSLENGQWKVDRIEIPWASEMALAAAGDTICVVSAVPDSDSSDVILFLRNGATHEWDKYSFNGGRLWNNPFNKSSTPNYELNIQLGESFLAIQCQSVWKKEYYVWDTYAFRWNKDGSAAGSSPLERLNGSSYDKSFYESTPHCYMTCILNEIHLDFNIGTDEVKDMAHKEIFRFVGTGWEQTWLRSYSVVNQYYGNDACTVSKDGKSRFYSFDLNELVWKRREEIPKYSDGNTTYFEDNWAMFYDLAGTALMFIPVIGWKLDLAFEVVMFGVDQLITFFRSRGSDSGQTGADFFVAKDKVYHRETDGSYIKVGDLTLLNEELKNHATSNASKFILYQVKDARGKKQTRVQFLRNGGFWPSLNNSFIQLPQEETFLEGGVGPRSFATRDSGDGSLYLHQVTEERCSGAPAAFALRSVTIKEGFRSLQTEYIYDGSQALPRSFGAMLFGKVTTLYSGAGFRKNSWSGAREAYFNALPPTGSTTGPDRMTQGVQWKEIINDAAGNRISQWTQDYETYSVEPPGRPDAMGYYLRPTQRTETVDGTISVTTPAYLATNGMVATSQHVTTDVAGNDSTFTTEYTYAFTQATPPEEKKEKPTPYDILKLKNNLVARCQVEQKVTDSGNNTVTTGITASTWGPCTRDSEIIVPLGSYQALVPTAEFDFPTNSPKNSNDWNQTEEAQAWDKATGQTTEVGVFPATGVRVTNTNILDTTGELTLATVANASAENNECGFYGFDGNDQSEGWQVSSTRITRESGQFQPRAGAPAYIVSAYFLFEPGQSPSFYPTLGFGSHSITVQPDLQWQWSSGTARRQFAQFVITNPTSSDLPFANFPAGAGTIQGFRFGPVDAPFTAALYDKELQVPLTNFDNNGYSETMVLDYRRRPSAIVTPEGGVNALMWQSDAKPAEFVPGEPMRKFVPSQSMSLNARNGGPYLAQTRQGQQDYNSTTDNAAVQVKIPVLKDIGINFKITFAYCSLQCVFGVRDRQGTLTLDDDGQNRIQGNVPVTETLVRRPNKLTVWFAPERLWVWIDDVPFMDVGLTSLNPSPGQNFPLSVSDANTGPSRGAGARLRDLCVAFDPIASASSANGLGQTVQTQTMGDDAKSMVYRQNFWNGWGIQEIQTKPMSGSLGPWSYLSTCATFDESTGQLSGDVVSYYMRQPQYEASDAPYAYSRMRSEANPLARLSVATLPGQKFQTAGMGQTTFTYGTQDTYASSLLGDLGLSGKASSFNARTSLRYIGTQAVPEVTLTNQIGQTAATSLGAVAANKQTETSLSTYPDGSRESVLTPPGGAAYATTTNSTFWGTPTNSQNSDTGTTNYMATYAGQIRFVQRPQKDTTIIIVNKYDGLGRVVERGELTASWDSLTQANAEDPDYPQDGAENYQVRVTMYYDIDPADLTANLQGRLWKSVTNVSGDYNNETTQTFTYDPQGRVLTTDLTVSAYDSTPRETTYTYDWMGNVVTLSYPEGEFVLNYAYNVNGRLAQITDASSNVQYASYTCTLEGAIDVVQLNNSTWYRQYGYTFQGALQSTEFSNYQNSALWNEALEYKDDSGFLGGNIASTNITLGDEESIALGYDSQGRLFSAKYTFSSGTQGDPQMTYDSRNNLSGVSGTQYGDRLTTQFDKNSNKLSSVTVSEAGTGNPVPQGNFTYSYTPDGKVTDSCLVKSTEYDPVLQQTISTSPQNSSSTVVSFQYKDPGAQRVLKVVSGNELTRLYLHGIQPLPLRELDWTDGKEETPMDYIYGVEGLIAYRQGNTLTFVVPDHLGSIRATIDGSSLYQLNEVAYYDVFGTFDPSPYNSIDTSKFRYLYTGQEYDSELGMYNYRRRLYDPTTSSFLTEDPLKEDYSLYAYVGGNPENFIDPTGMSGRGLNLPRFFGQIKRHHFSFQNHPGS